MPAPNTSNQVIMKIGDKVKWTSQSGGDSTEKQGVITYVISANTRAQNGIRVQAIQQKTHTVMFDGCSSRSHESYIVEVHQPGKRRPKMYWPRVSQLILIK